MFINKRKEKYGWYAKIESKDNGDNVLTDYMNFSFKKDCEPFKDDLNEYGAYEGEMYFKDKDGKYRRIFPIVKEYNGAKHIEFKLLGVEGAKPTDLGFTVNKQVGLNDGQTDMFGNQNYIDPDDLPFY